MRKLSAILIAAVLAVPAAAEDKGERTHVAEAVIAAVMAGRSVNTLGLQLSVDEDESMRFAQLKGCKPSVGKGSTSSLIYVVWDCLSTASDASLAETTKPALELHFEGEKLTRLWLNPLISERLPTSIALSADDLPTTKTIAKRFTEAVASEGDYSVAGLVPLSSAQSGRLKELKGCEAGRMSASTRLREIYLWRCSNQSGSRRPLLEMHFDGKGRPIGLDFGVAITMPGSR